MEYADLSADDIREYANEMFGAENLNEKMTNGTEVRYGAKGAICVTVKGQWRGRYKDWDSGEKGWVLPEDLRPMRGQTRKRKEGKPEDVVTPEEAARRAEEETLRKAEAEEAERQRQQALARKQAHICEQWATAEPITQTPAETYLLETRRLPVAVHFEQLRWHPDNRLPVDSDFRHPALLVAFRCDDQEDIVGIGAIRIDPATGGKAEVSVPKPCYHLGSELGKAVYVQLGDPEATTMVIGEGLETSLSRLVLAPCDLRVCWGPLQFLEPPEHVRRVEIIADRDKLESARKLARQYARRKGIQAYVLVPPRECGPKGDLNDVLLQHPGPEGLELLQQVVGDAEHIEDTKGSAATSGLVFHHASDVEIGQAIIERLEDLYGPVVIDDGTIWFHDGRQYRALKDHVLVRHIHSADGVPYRTVGGDPSVVRLSKSRVNSIADSMLAYRQRQGYFSEIGREPTIPVANGILVFDPATGDYRLEEPSRRYRNRHVMRGRFLEEYRAMFRDMEAGSTEAAALFRKTSLGTLLFGCFRDDADAAQKVALMQELAGVAAAGWATRLRRPRAVIGYGDTANNGKSQFSDLLRSMVPAEAQGAVSPSDFGNEYYTYQLIGVLVNCLDELPEKAIASDRFKAVITGERIPCRQIYREAGMMTPTALHWFTTNQLPSFRGGVDNGVLRRLLFVHFTRRIPDEEIIPNLGERIAAEEPDLLVAFAAEGLRRVLRQGDYTVPVSSEETLQTFLEQADPVRGWLAERTTYDPRREGKPLSAAEAYTDFTAWCADQGIRSEYVVRKHVFGDRVTRAIPGLVKRKINGYSHYVGLSLRSAPAGSGEDDFADSGEPTGSVAEWLAERTVPDHSSDTVTLSAHAAYLDYVAWCERRGVEAETLLPEHVFERGVDDAVPGIRTHKRDGRTHYIGLRLRAEGAA